MKKFLILLILPFTLNSCTKTKTNPNQTNSSIGEEGTNNYEPSFSFSFNGSTYTAESSTNTYGSKAYLLGLDSKSNLLIDLDLPVKKDEIASNKAFKIENQDGYGNCVFYINGDQWTIEGGSLNITANKNNRISGNFSGKSFKMDYSKSPPEKVDEAELLNGAFKDLEIQ